MSTFDQRAEPSVAALFASALRQEEFVLYRQEIRSLKPKGGGRPLQEILIRFQQEEDRLLPPGTFFPVLEENGLMVLLDRWVVTKVCQWIHSGLAIKPDWRMPCNSINLSQDAVFDNDFPAFVAKHLDVGRIPDGALAFEIGWQTVTGNATQVHAFMSQLRKAGCRFIFSGFDGSMDAVAGLRYLKPDCIKINTRLSLNLRAGSPESQAVGVIASTCAALGIGTVAEQIETAEAVAELQRIGVDYVQGFGVTRPQPLY